MKSTETGRDCATNTKTYSMEGQAGTTRWGGEWGIHWMECGRGRCGARPGYGGGAREKGEIIFWKSARDIILVPTSDVVIRPGPRALRHRINRIPFPPPLHLSFPPALLIHPLLSPRSIITDATRVQYPSCPEVNPRNTVHPLTSSPLNPINKNNNNSHLPLTRTFPPIL
jgi:hypothetical protein